MGAIGGAVSAASGIMGLINGAPANNVPTPQLQNYQFGGMSGADQGAQGGTQNLSQYNTAGQLMPQYNNLVQQGANNPYAPGFQQGAGTAGQMGMQAGAGAYGAGGQIGNASIGTLPDVNALLQLGFDPQNALYSQLQQQNTDQTRAAEAARGIQSSPYGAGVENQSNQNFNLAWQNNQLGRAAQGAGAAGSLLGQAGQGAQMGSNLQAGGVGEYLQGAGTPYNTFQGINSQALGTLGQGAQFGNMAATIPQQQIQDYLSYLAQGTGANAVANQGSLGLGNFQLQQANSGFNQNQTMGSDIGQGLSMIGKSGFGMSSNPFAQYFNGGGGMAGGGKG